MGRREQRERIVTILYIHIMGGQYEESLFDDTTIQMANEVIQYAFALDKIISTCLENYTIDRLNYMDLAILRYATYEMKYTKTPYQVAINEAIELTKKYTNLDDGKAKNFNNRLLDTIKNYLETTQG